MGIERLARVRQLTPCWGGPGPWNGASARGLAVTEFVSNVLMDRGVWVGDLAMTDFVSSIRPFFSLIAWRTPRCRIVADLR